MKLSAEQIERLYQFTRQHYVEYYDLQSELVDHLANAIEEQWQENPKLSFEEALQIEFKKFGIFGFSEVVEQRQSALNKKYTKMVWNELKEFFSIPKIIGTISAIGIVFYLMKQLQNDFWIVQLLFLFLFVSYFIGLIILVRKNKKNNIVTQKKWLLKDIIYGYGSTAGFMNLPLQASIHLDANNYNNWVIFLFSFVLVVLFLTEYIMLIYIPSKAEDYLKQTYPEYELLEKV
jgi:hypothetical protein